jgi:hypothetical protein
MYRFADPADPETVAVETLVTDLVLTEKPDVERYALLFERLRAAALPAEQSLDWLRETARAMGASGGHTPPRPREHSAARP